MSLRQSVPRTIFDNSSINCGLTYRLVEGTIARPTRVRGYTGTPKGRLRFGRTFYESEDGNTDTTELELRVEAIIADFRRVHLVNRIHMEAVLQAEKPVPYTNLTGLNFLSPTQPYENYPIPIRRPLKLKTAVRFYIRCEMKWVWLGLFFGEG